MSIKLNVDPHLLLKHSDNYIVTEVDGNTVGECLNHLAKQMPIAQKTLFDRNSNLSSTIYVFVNKKAVLSEKLAKPVKDRDEISLIDGTSRGCPCAVSSARLNKELK